MKNKIYFILLFFIAVKFANAQPFIMTDTKAMLIGRMTPVDDVIDIKGTPYLSPLSFEVKNIDNYTLDFKKLRYNAYSDEMEYEKQGSTYILDRIKNMKIHFEYPVTIFQLLEYNYKGENIYGYLNVLVDDENISLYKKSKIVIDSKAYSGAFAAEKNNQLSRKYVKLNDVYLIKKDGKLIEFPKNAKKFFNNDAVDKFIKENKINVTNEMDKIKLINFINTL